MFYDNDVLVLIVVCLAIMCVIGLVASYDWWKYISWSDIIFIRQARGI